MAADENCQKSLSFGAKSLYILRFGIGFYLRPLKLKEKCPWSLKRTEKVYKDGLYYFKETIIVRHWRVCLTAFLSLSLFLSFSFSLSFILFFSFFFSIFHSLSLTIYLFFFISFFLLIFFFCLSVSLSFFLSFSIYISIFLFWSFLSLYLTLYLSLFISFCLSILLSLLLSISLSFSFSMIVYLFLYVSISFFLSIFILRHSNTVFTLIMWPLRTNKNTILLWRRKLIRTLGNTVLLLVKLNIWLLRTNKKYNIADFKKTIIVRN